MALIGCLTTQKLVGILASEQGVTAAIGPLAAAQGLVLPPIAKLQIIAQNAAAEIFERSTGKKYPVIHAYCAKIVNLQREKFRVFSGEAQMVVEARVSQDRMDELESRVQTYAGAITQVLEESRGDWGDGICYNGGYEVIFGGVKQGGNNFIQTAKISFVLDISRD